MQLCGPPEDKVHEKMATLTNGNKEDIKATVIDVSAIKGEIFEKKRFDPGNSLYGSVATERWRMREMVGW
jgi:hypothetical protein